MAMKKSQKPNPDGALSRIKAMGEVPRETPLEKFVLDNFDAIVSLKSQNYTVPDIVKVLKEEGYAASAPNVHAALNRAASLLDKLNPYKRVDAASELTESAVDGYDELLPETTKKSKLAYGG